MPTCALVKALYVAKKKPKKTGHQASMSKEDAVINELKQLDADGMKLLDTLPSDDAEPRRSFILDYQTWFTQAVKVVEIIIPDRLSEFRGYYEIEPKRKTVHHGNYVIQDYCKAVRPGRRGNFDCAARAGQCLINQIAILRSATPRISSIIANLQALILADVRDLELETAQELQEVSLRAAGALAGVVLERHLQQLTKAHKLTFRKKRPTLSDFSESLKKASIIDVPAWRKLSYLADIRNICCHPKGPEPTKEQVRELIDGVNWALKNVL